MANLKGRAPWYDLTTGRVKDPLIIGVAGGSCSGKMEFCNQIKKDMKLLGNQLVCISEHSFYKTPPPDSNSQNYNWDHPAAVDFELFFETINSLKLGKNVEIKEKKHSPHDHLEEEGRGEEVYGADVLLVVGTLVLYDPKVRELMDLKVFIDADQDSCLVRRLRRDCFVRKFNCKSVLQKYNDHVKPGYNSYILPSKQFANVIVPCRSKWFDDVSISLITQFISTKLIERDNYELTLEMPQWSSPPHQVHIMPQTQLIRSLSTILRDEKTDLVDFIFQTDRLSRLLAEFALESVVADMYKGDEKEVDTGVQEVITPTGSVYSGVKLDYSKVSVVSIMRAGEALETGVREVIKDIKIGKMLIQSENKAPRLYYCSLHNIISPDAPVLLLDATLATGSTVKMAVRVLLDHGVQEKNIYFLTIVCSPQGVHSVLSTYSKVKIFTASMDADLDDNFYITPGIGNFGDRYFGT